MKKLLKLACLTLVMSSTLPVYSYDIFHEGIYYNIVSAENFEVEVTFREEESYSTYYSGDVVIPDEITVDETTYYVAGIGDGAFENQYELSTLTLGRNIRNIGELCFSNCPSLIAINVVEENTEYCSYEGVLYNHDMSTLIKYPQHKFSNTIYIPSTVTRIGDYAMSALEGAPEIKMTGSVTELGKGCFAQAQWGIRVDLSVNVTEIPDEAFMSCGSGQGSVDINLDHITSIGEYAFSWTRLNKMCAPNLSHIGQKAFEKSEIEFVIISDKCKMVPLNAFWETSIAKGAYPENINSFFPEGSRNPFTYSNVNNFYGKSVFIPYPEGSKIENGEIISADGTILYYAPEIGAFKNYITPEGVTTIGDYAFAYSGGDIVTFRPSVTKISPSAFFENNAWYYNIGPEAGIETNNNFFKTIDGILYDISGKTLIGCPQGLHRMVNGRYDYVRDLSLPSVVENVSDYAFYQTHIDNITFSAPLKNIGNHAFENTIYDIQINIPSVTGSIGDFAFANRRDLSTLKVEPTVRSIGTGAFMNCIALEHLDLPETITEIPDSLFLGCSVLDNIIIPDGVTRIGTSAFMNCKGMTSIAMPNPVYKLGANAFRECIGITDINISGVTEIPDYALYNCKSLAEVEIPVGVTHIGQEALYNTNVKSADLRNINTLGKNAFWGCKNLEDVKIGNTLTDIETGTFRSCTSLKKVELGSGINYIKEGAFSRCEALSEVIAHSETPARLQSFSPDDYFSIFPSSIFKTCNLYVPQESLEAYKNKNLWNRYFENIYPMQQSGLTYNLTTHDIEIINYADGIRIINADCKNVSVYDMSGAILFDEKAYSGATIHLPKGMYIVKVASTTHKITR